MDNSKPRFRLILSAFLFLLIFLIMVFSIFFVNKKSSSYKAKATGTGVALSLIPSTISAQVGTDFTVTVTINTNDKTVSAAELHLTYDPTKLQAKSITSFGYLPVVLTTGSVGNGTASIVLGSQPSTPQKGSGILASLVFTPLSSSPSEIGFAGGTEVAAVGEFSNVVDTTTGAQVSIESTPIPTTTSVPPTLTLVPPTSTPVPTATATPIPTATPVPTTIPTPIPTNTPPPIATNTPIPTATPTPAPTSTSVPPRATNTPVPPTTALTSTLLAGDINHDGKVDVKDYNQLITDFGKTGSPGWTTADINRDGKVDVFDYNVIVGSFGNGAR